LRQVTATSEVEEEISRRAMKFQRKIDIVLILEFE